MVPIVKQIISHDAPSLQTAANIYVAAGCSSVTHVDAGNAHDIVTATAHSLINQMDVPVAATIVKKAGKRKRNGVNAPKRAKMNQGPFACGFLPRREGEVRSCFLALDLSTVMGRAIFARSAVLQRKARVGWMSES